MILFYVIHNFFLLNRRFLLQVVSSSRPLPRPAGRTRSSRRTAPAALTSSDEISSSLPARTSPSAVPRRGRGRGNNVIHKSCYIIHFSYSSHYYFIQGAPGCYTVRDLNLEGEIEGISEDSSEDEPDEVSPVLSWTLLHDSCSSGRADTRAEHGAAPDDLNDASTPFGTSLRGNKRVRDEDDSANEDNRLPPPIRKRVSVINILNNI